MTDTTSGTEGDTAGGTAGRPTGSPAAGPQGVPVHIEDFRRQATEMVMQGLRTMGVSEETLEDLGVERLLAVPPRPEMGDFAFPCFPLARLLRKAPAQIAAELAQQLSKALDGEKLLSAVESAGPYLNFRLNHRLFAETVVRSAVSQGTEFGAGEEGSGKTVVIDYSSPNISKPFHVAHLRSTIIGAALYRLFKKLGFHVVGINHLGDWGTQFGRQIVGLKRYGKPEDIDDLSALNRHYVRFHQEEANDPSLAQEAREWFQRLESGDPEALRLWKAIRETSLRYYRSVYERIGVHFDSYDGEAFFNDKMEPVIREATEKGVAVESEGALIIDLEDEGIDTPALLRKSDGTTLYVTRDLAAAVYRKRTYDFHRMLYVVSVQQNLHFRQLFACLNKLGYEWWKDCVHVNFGMMPGMSTRQGTMIYLEDVFDEAKRRILAYMQENRESRPEVEDEELVAETVGKAAVFFADLNRQRIKDYTFDWDRACSFEGDTGPYLMNAYARIAGIIRKCGVELDERASLEPLVEPEARLLVSLVAKFPAILRDAADSYEPSLLASYLLELAHALHAGYGTLRVKGRPAGQAQARLMLFVAVKTVLGEGMKILGITPLERM